METEKVRFLSDGSGVTLTSREVEAEGFYLTLDDVSGWRGVFDVGLLRGTPEGFLAVVAEALGRQDSYFARANWLEEAGCPCFDCCNEEQSR